MASAHVMADEITGEIFVLVTEGRRLLSLWKRHAAGVYERIECGPQRQAWRGEVRAGACATGGSPIADAATYDPNEPPPAPEVSPMSPRADLHPFPAGTSAGADHRSA